MRELRCYRAAGAPELRAAGDGEPPVLSGYGAVFDRLSQNLGGFVEQVDPHAFDDTLRRVADRNILGAVNHDVNWLLATTDSGTLQLATDAVGLRYDMTLNVADPDAIRAMAKVESRMLRGSSFSFATREEAWSTTPDGFPMRSLLAVELYELGPVASPAYLQTQDGGAAVALRSLSEFVDLPFEQVTEAAAAGRLTDLILRDLPEVPVEEPEPESPVDNPDSAPVRRARRNPPTR